VQVTYHESLPARLESRHERRCGDEVFSDSAPGAGDFPDRAFRARARCDEAALEAVHDRTVPGDDGGQRRVVLGRREEDPYGFTKKKNQIEGWKAILTFLDKSLKGEAAAPAKAE
jgi:hypothetical protein